MRVVFAVVRGALIRKKRTVPLLISVCRSPIVTIGSLPLKPPIAITGLFVARISGDARAELAVATRNFVFPCWLSR